MPRSRRFDMYDGVAASGITSNAIFVGDAEEMTWFFRGSPSTTTVQGSNATGFRETIAEADWSTLTTITSPSPDLVNIEPGFRWMRTLRSETTEVTANLYGMY